MRTGGVEPPQHEAPRLQRGELTSCSASAWSKGGRPGSNRRLRGSQPRVLPSTPRPPRESGDDRTRTGGLSPDKRALCSSELRPRRSSAGGIRTHGLELMRLARTAAPLPRKSGWQESNLRSPAPEAGGVAKLPYSQKTNEYPRRDSNPQLPG